MAAMATITTTSSASVTHTSERFCIYTYLFITIISAIIYFTSGEGSICFTRVGKTQHERRLIFWEEGKRRLRG